MNEIMSQLLTSEVQTVLLVLLGIVVVLYLLSIFWAARDARARASAGHGACFPLSLS